LLPLIIKLIRKWFCHPLLVMLQFGKPVMANKKGDHHDMNLIQIDKAYRNELIQLTANEYSGQ